MRRTLKYWLTLSTLIAATMASAPTFAQSAAELAALDLTRASTWGACRQYCNGRESLDGASSSRRIKARDVLRMMLDASNSEEIRLLRLKNPTTFAAVSKVIGTSAVNYHVSVSHQGARMRLRSQLDELSLSVRSSPAEDLPNDYVTGVGLELRW